MQISMAAQRKQIIKLTEVFMEVNEGIGFCHIDKGGGGGCIIGKGCSMKQYVTFCKHVFQYY